MQHRKIKLIILSLFSMAIFSNAVLQSQEIIWGNSVGLFGGANINMHSLNMMPSFVFPPLISQNKINLIETTNSVTGFAGLEGNFQLSNLFVLTTRVSYDFAGLDINAIDRNTNYDIKTSLHYLEFSPMLKLVNLISNMEQLYFTTGFNIGVPITKQYDITQRAGNTIRNNVNDIPDAQMQMSIPIGIGYIWKYSWELAIIPEISYNIGLNDVASDAGWQTWNFNQLKAGVSITYKLPSKKKNKVVETKLPTKIDIAMENIYSVDKNGRPQKVDVIKLEEAEYGEYFPLIPYIFYEVNETDVPVEYVHKSNIETSSAGGQTEEVLPNDAANLAYMLLDVVGKRLQDNPNANLVITGNIDNKYETGMSISEGRAREVKNYLQNKYNILDSRLRVEHRTLPAKPSAQSVKDGIVENRRVELSSNIQSIFDPVFVKGEKTRFATPDNIHFVPMAESNKPITGWELEIYQADRIIKQFSGEEIEEIKWNIMMNDLYPSELPIEYKYTIYTDDSVESHIGYIKLDYISVSKNKAIEQPDYVINKYSLVLFDFDSPHLTEQNKQVIDKFIIPNVKFGSNVDIYGYSDRIGNAEYNRRLSLQRAEAVRDYIRSKNRNVSIKTNGLGNDTEIFDNDIPVGRQLSRTVQILVVTPKE